jgi:hypothetical protein
LAIANTLTDALMVKQIADAVIVVRNRVKKKMKNFATSTCSPAHYK